ncbi:protein boule-like isoform X3 [Gadus chalcogrammus]|uniref:protein boule-like isoform X3 n=1 Tax=Gadus chalcogrammus TaxID=1042646 RepID=UPI0024C2925E|nr:protein boule-like isoform X3 [Gadus chalcogrammus]
MLEDMTTEEDIWRFFSRHGAVKEVNIVFNHMGLSKGYGFVTFDSQVDARRLLEMAPSLLFQGRHLLVAPAVRRLSRRQRSGCEADRAQCVLHLTTPSGHPYTFCNGVAYFRRPEPAPPAHYGPLVVAPHGHYGPTVAPPAHYGPTAAPHGHYGPPYQFMEQLVQPAFCQIYPQSPVGVCAHHEYREEE